VNCRPWNCRRLGGQATCPRRLQCGQPGASSRIALTRPVDLGRDRFPQTNDWLYTVITIRTRDGQETFAIPTIDVPLVHAALELANAEDPLNSSP
jgi:hypothetical protein